MISYDEFLSLWDDEQEEQRSRALRLLKKRKRDSLSTTSLSSVLSEDSTRIHGKGMSAHDQIKLFDGTSENVLMPTLSQ